MSYNLKIQSLRQEMEYLYQALKNIKALAPYDEIYGIANVACDAYSQNRQREKENEENLTDKKRKMGWGRAS